ncbi:GNAT family N-acetyltransferase [Actinocatenispora sera]|uniref:GNAT family N-acetyltransferase n=1 Tax=Actinocatenispora sera TaxID=390989 RepID=UPI0033E76C87
MSDRLRLDEVVATDADRLYAALTDPAMSDETRSPFRSLAGTMLWVGHRVDDRDSHGLCSYLLRDRDTGELVGVCGVRLGQAAAEPELGYRIAARYRRRSLATEAATAVVDECRNAGLRRVWASIRPDNIASRRVVEQLGMRLAATDQDNSGPLHRYTVEL